MRATNFARATYQEVYDVMTRDGVVSIFGFHTPTGEGPYSMLHGFFSQFRKYKYSGMKVNVIPAAQLPADPLQISYEAGTESYIDPRDLQNPVLFHGAHGNNLGEVLNLIYSGAGVKFSSTSADGYEIANGYEGDNFDLEQWYYASMLDPSFRKFNVMNNMSLPFMSPRVHNVAFDISVQPSYTGQATYVEDTPMIKDDPDSETSTNVNILTNVVPNMPYINNPTMVGNDVPVNIMTNRLARLGWRDTFTFTKANGNLKTGDNITVSPLPKIMMGALIFPPSYRTKLAFRIVVSHYFEFARFNTSITPTMIGRVISLAGQDAFNYHNFLPDELATSLAESDSVDVLNGDVRQSVSGVM